MPRFDHTDCDMYSVWARELGDLGPCGPEILVAITTRRDVAVRADELMAEDYPGFICARLCEDRVMLRGSGEPRIIIGRIAEAREEVVRAICPWFSN